MNCNFEENSTYVQKKQLCDDVLLKESYYLHAIYSK